MQKVCLPDNLFRIGFRIIRGGMLEGLIMPLIGMRLIHRHGPLIM